MPAGGRSSGLSFLLFSVAVWFRASRPTLLECLPRGAPVQVLPLVGALAIVGDEELVQGHLHLVDGLELSSDTQFYALRRHLPLRTVVVPSSWSGSSEPPRRSFVGYGEMDSTIG